MYQLILVTMLVINGKLEIQQHKIELFYTASDCQKLKVVLEQNTLLKLMDNTTNAVIVYDCRREI